MAVNFDIYKTIELILNGGKFQNFIIEANQSQLADRGEDTKGQEIRTFKAKSGNVYSIPTIVIKGQKGQPTDRVTLFDTGKFYDSMAVKVNKTFAEVTANSQSLAQIFDNISTDFDILGLNEANTNKLAELLKVELQNEIDLYVGKILVV